MEMTVANIVWLLLCLGIVNSPIIFVFMVAGLCGWYRGSDDPGASC